MAHRHSHGGGVLMLDTLAARSGLRNVSPSLKTGFCVLVLLLCVGASDAVVGIFVALSMVLLMVSIISCWLRMVKLSSSVLLSLCVVRRMVVSSSIAWSVSSSVTAEQLMELKNV